jgi:2-dehydropantoate 2-reductase
MDIAVIGAGAMGGLYGGLLARTGSNVVTLVDVRADIVEAVNASGLVIETPEGLLTIKVKAAASAEGVKTQDLIIVLVKSSATREAARLGAALAGPETVALSLQNGLGNLEILAEVLGEARVVGGSTSFGAWVRAPGVVVLGGRGRTAIGELGGGESPRLRRLAAALSEAGLAPEMAGDVKCVVWTKLLANVGINALAGILGVQNGRLLELPAAAALMAGAVGEAEAVAKALGVKLGGLDALAHCHGVCRATAANVCSTLQDFRARRPTEIGAMNGAVAEAGRRLGVPVPVNEALGSLIKALEEAY